jgi:hypothetical protein
MRPGIFISYRREDTAGDAGRLADHLHLRFGHVRVFLDVDAIAPGTDFPQVLKASLAQTAAVLVVIGQRWVSLVGGDGVRRLESPGDFVRLEVEEALARGVLVVPVLVQGAAMPRAEDLPPSLAPLVTRQAAVIDHAEFHADAERLCVSLEAALDGAASRRWSLARRWWPAAALAVALGGAGLARHARQRTTSGPTPDASTPLVDSLVAEATAERARNQLVEALGKLAQAHALAPSSLAVRDLQEDVAMQWIREVRVADDKSSFGDAIKPALAVIDAALPSATGVRRADLLAHEGWASYLVWRDGDRRLDPASDYRAALAIDPGNPYANAMLAHWVLGQSDDLPRAVKLFETAGRSRRAVDAVRSLEWAAYSNADTPAADAQRVRLANAMRREGLALNPREVQALWQPYYFDHFGDEEKRRRELLAAVAPDEHIATLTWAFAASAATDEMRGREVRYYVALLNATAGRTAIAVEDLRALDKELAKLPGSLADAVRAALRRLEPEPEHRQPRRR